MSASSSHPKTQRMFPWPLVALLVISGSLMLGSALSRSLTVDEPMHIVRGVSYWQTGEGRLSYAHPPLNNVLTALPGALVFDGHLAASPAWKQPNNTELAKRYIRRFFSYLHTDSFGTGGSGGSGSGFPVFSSCVR